jgi:hypothetical protein
MLIVTVPSGWREMTGSIRNLSPHFHVLTSPGLYEYSWKLHQADGAPMEMIQKLANSERVQQVFVRHAFRFWMGRNETINDAPILQAASKAYRDSNGSMKALLTVLLTSDAFLYRRISG